jgi:hypothetical protein
MKIFLGFILLAFLSISSSSCRKEKLDGEELILLGKWEWLKADVVWKYKNSSNPGTPSTIGSELGPSDLGAAFGIEFTENGRLNYFKNGEMKSNCRFKFIKTYINSMGEFCFAIQVNWKGWDPVVGVVNISGDTLKTAEFYPNLDPAIPDNIELMKAVYVYVKE